MSERAGHQVGLRRFLYAVDEAGNEIPGSRRDITDIAGDWRKVWAAEGELRARCGEDCEVVDRWE